MLTSLSDKQYEAIGHIAVNWATFEITFMYALWGVSKLNVKQGRALTTHTSHLSKIDAVKTVLDDQYSGQSLQTDMLDFISRSEPYRLDRNLIVHGQWSIAGSSTSRVISHTARGSIDLKNKTFTLQQMADLANNILDIEQELSKYLMSNGLFPDFS